MRDKPPPTNLDRRQSLIAAVMRLYQMTYLEANAMTTSQLELIAFNGPKQPEPNAEQK